ncbi:MAG: LacI family DNA-binding transcriptional regulator [Atopobiaceae bacterium]|jgi:LacI family transcriptional regulator/LacI family purine nucleotide synthesis repressor|nr:LacI family DNA-binding transcriptional regulator [Atopobiaceae bacterium]MCI2173994.1 LacI family DNA-binding transcriptional regulator [Atopobiaceae bacterium]MCI2207916.1 LacI family DNA-binding transcriptional regulator [Atopobiaceae bacterium]
MAKVSVREISRRTGYSPATVSNALNHKKGVSRETADSIIAVAQDLGYQRPERLDRIVFVLARKNGLVVDESMFHPAVIDGVERQARRYGLQTSYVTLELADKKAAAKQVEELTQDTSGGIVLLGTEMQEEDFRLFDDVTTPFILLDSWSDEHFFESINISNEDASYRATKYLISKGHKRIGYLSGSFAIRNFPNRGMGYRHAMESVGLEADPAYHVSVGTTLESAYQDMLSWLSHSPELPTAFFCDNDVLAVGAMRALMEKGYRVPDDVSFVGFDDLPFASFANPPLTTIHVPKREFGELAVKKLMENIKSPKGYVCKTQMSTIFVERESVREI